MRFDDYSNPHGPNEKTAMTRRDRIDLGLASVRPSAGLVGGWKGGREGGREGARLYLLSRKCRYIIISILYVINIHISIYLYCRDICWYTR
jgi:hypothetical protein